MAKHSRNPSQAVFTLIEAIYSQPKDSRIVEGLTGAKDFLTPPLFQPGWKPTPPTRLSEKEENEAGRNLARLNRAISVNHEQQRNRIIV